MKFLPQRAPIDKFGGGGFRFAAMSHLGSLLVVPSGMRAWEPVNAGDLTIADFSIVVEEKSEIDFLIIGTGAKMLRLPIQLIAELQSQNVAVDVMSTSSAIHNYNMMLEEGRRVAAGLIAVELAHERTL
jgi:uncharacterized protein